MGQQRETVCNLFGSLSLSSRQAPVSQELRHAIAAALHHWPELESHLAGIPPTETYRRWLAVVDWRLHASGQMRPSAPPPPGAYGSSSELADDVRIIQRSLSGAHNGGLVQGEIQRWVDQIQVFGLQWITRFWRWRRRTSRSPVITSGSPLSQRAGSLPR
ncbi:MAG: phosphoenolpyruvate carboxylase [Planctomycetes bacterium]|nr:phosphoenolpyruvate carboxylase [Planctomycetota bacterium]